MKDKPEIWYDREKEMFTIDNVSCTVAQAKERWYAVDSEWSTGAYNKMFELIYNPPGGNTMN